MQIADLPGSTIAKADLSRFYRMLPGDGVLPLGEFVEALESIGYSHVCALEILSDRYRALSPLIAAQEAMASIQRWGHELASTGHLRVRDA